MSMVEFVVLLPALDVGIDIIWVISKAVVCSRLIDMYMIYNAIRHQVAAEKFALTSLLETAPNYQFQNPSYLL